MAIFHLSVKPVQRSKGRSATASAAYRAAAKIADARTGELHDYTRKRGVVYTEILTPESWQIDRASLWNLAEAAERRKDGTTAREYELALPAELTTDQRTELARSFGHMLVERHGVAVDIAIHAPSHEGDGRNHHAHILATTRRFSRGLLTGKSDFDLSDRDRKKKGLGTRRVELEAIRMAWATLCNRVLERVGNKEHINHQSLVGQGIMRGATIHLGPVATAMERRGEQTERGDLNRSQEERNADWYELEALEQVQAGITEARQKAHQWKKRQARAAAEEESRRQIEIERERQKQNEEAIDQREAQEPMPEPQVSGDEQERLEEKPQKRSLERL